MTNHSETTYVRHSYRPNDISDDSFELAIKLWSDNVIQEILHDTSKLPTDPDLPEALENALFPCYSLTFTQDDPATEYLPNLKRILQHDYVPTVNDILSVRVSTQGT